MTQGQDIETAQKSWTPRRVFFCFCQRPDASFRNGPLKFLRTKQEREKSHCFFLLTRCTVILRSLACKLQPTFLTSLQTLDSQGLDFQASLTCSSRFSFSTVCEIFRFTFFSKALHKIWSSSRRVPLLLVVLSGSPQRRQFRPLFTGYWRQTRVDASK